MAQVLINDDDVQLLQLLAVAFRKHGHTVTTAANGSQARPILQAQAFDVVITDIIMPEGDGIEVLSFLGHMKQRPAIITMSGGSQRLGADLILETARAMKSDLVLMKPLTPKQLLDAVETVLIRNQAP